MIMIFIFTHISYDQSLIDQDVFVGGMTWGEVRIPLSVGLPFLIVCLCWMVIIYSNNYYLNKKNQEFSILFMSVLLLIS